MSLKRKSLPFGILLCLLLTGFMIQAQKVNTIVLDAGHGGHDTGALGRHSREKDITLAIVLKLRDYIHQNLGDVKVILTRDKDEFIELYRRAQIANSNKADLFISVHCNANPSTAPYGSETFVMGLHKSTANLAVAKAENAAILLEDDYVEQYDGFDPNSPEGTIFFSMMQNAFLDNSLDLAGKIQKQFSEKLNLYNRGVKQAGFLVLYKTAMPGVLVETGFISNAREEKLLMSAKGQDQLAQAIFKAVAEYKFAIEKRDPAALKELVRNLPAPSGNNDETTGITEVITTDSVPSTVDEKVWYRVQFASSPADKAIDSQEFKGLPEIRKYFQNGLYKFTSGNFITFKEASNHRIEVVKKGFKDAFVVPFYRGERITPEEARRLTEK